MTKTKTTTTRFKTEHKLQEQVVKLLKMNNFCVINTDVMISLRFLHTQKDRILFIQSEKRMGYTKGQPDCVVYNKNGIFFLELKNGKKGSLSKEQKEHQKNITELGHKYIVIRDLEDCQKFIEEYK